MNDDKLIQIEQALYALADELEAKYGSPIRVVIDPAHPHAGLRSVERRRDEYIMQAGRLLVHAYEAGGGSLRLRKFIGTSYRHAPKSDWYYHYVFWAFVPKLFKHSLRNGQDEAAAIRWLAGLIRSTSDEVPLQRKQMRRERYRLPKEARIGRDEPEPYEFHFWEEALKSPDRVERLLMRRRGNPPIPAEIERFRNLRFLLGYVDKRLPDEIGNLPELRRLVVRGVDVALPDSIGKLTNLEVLLLSSYLKTLPEALTQLPNLRELSVSGKLETLPDEIGNLQALRILTIGYNRLRSLPESFARLNNLVWLDISGNDFERFPGDLLAELPKLEILTWGKYTKDPLPFPDDLLRLKALRRLHLRGKTTKEELELLRALRPELDIRTW